MGGKVHQWRRHNAQIDDVTAGIKQTVPERFGQGRAGQAAISAKIQRRIIKFDSITANRQADQVDAVGGQVFACLLYTSPSPRD